MKVRVLFFGYLSEMTERNEVELSLDAGSRVADVVAHVREEFPALASMERSIRWALNAEYCDEGAPLADGDVVSFIPPVSGG